MLNKKYLVFDISLVLYFFFFLLYNLSKYKTDFGLIFIFLPIIIPAIIIYILYKNNIYKNKKKLFIFFISYVVIIAIYRLFLLFFLNVDLIQDIYRYMRVYSLDGISIFFIILEIIILNIYYNYFFRENLIETK